ncbi:MAG: serine/threonine-protein kinase [Planctomycetota bacterium]
MKDDLHTSNEQLLTASQRDLLDEKCDAFEAQWRQQDWPRLEYHLDGCEDPLRSALVQELLKIEVFWRSRTADPRQLRSDLQARFPQHRETVDVLLGTSTASEGQLLGQGKSLGHFQNLEKIGDGGFGIVFRAWDSRHQRQVALKIPRFAHQLAGRELEEFFREAKAAGSLDHPNIARVWDSGTTGGVTYIAYQLVEGENLKVRLNEFVEKPPLQIAEFVRHLALAVEYAHQQGIIHRDIKPSNILLTDENQPVLTDFGLALTVGGDATRSLAARIGTLDYMSPEQAAGAQEEISAGTDLWSLGVLLYELLTGALPFEGATDLQLCNNICKLQHKRPRQLRSSIPKDLEIIVDRCLQKRPADRLTSCGELADELARIESGHPIRSRRVSFVELATRWCRRNPRPMIAFAAVLAATVFGSWSWGLRLAESEQNENVVQQLQLQLEVKNAERRELLSQLMLEDLTELTLLEKDLDFFANLMLSSTDKKQRLFAAEVLLENGAVDPVRFPTQSAKRTAAIEVLLKLVNTTIDPDLREAAEAALLTLGFKREE